MLLSRRPNNHSSCDQPGQLIVFSLTDLASQYPIFRQSESCRGYQIIAVCLWKHKFVWIYWMWTCYQEDMCKPVQTWSYRLDLYTSLLTDTLTKAGHTIVFSCKAAFLDLSQPIQCMTTWPDSWIICRFYMQWQQNEITFPDHPLKLRCQTQSLANIAWMLAHKKTYL